MFNRRCFSVAILAALLLLLALPALADAPTTPAFAESNSLDAAGEDVRMFTTSAPAAGSASDAAVVLIFVGTTVGLWAATAGARRRVRGTLLHRVL